MVIRLVILLQISTLWGAFLSSNPWYYSRMGLEPLQDSLKCTHPIRVAVLDDGFDLKHPMLQSLWSRNSGDPINGLDDDDDGFIDNQIGYDLANQDGDPSIPSVNSKHFYHGTFLSGEMMRIWSQVLGPQFHKCVQVIPIKVVLDEKLPIQIHQPVKSLRFALKLPVDFILTAWGVNFQDSLWSTLSQDLEQSQALVVASAGNLDSEQNFYPASLARVVSVASVDSELKKMPLSNYQSQVLLAGPGSANIGLSQGYAGWIQMDGQTSSASAVVLAKLVLERILSPQSSHSQLLLKMVRQAHSVDQANPTYVGRLGFGIPTSMKQEFSSHRVESTQSQGSFTITQDHYDSLQVGPWPWQTVRPSTFKIFQNNQLLGKQKIQSNTQNFKIPFKQDIGFHSDAKNPLWWIRRSTIKTAQQYCRGRVVLQDIPESRGVILDGSERASYQSLSDCQWLIKAPEGHRIRLEFVKFNTELNRDKVLIFEGQGTQQTHQLAEFSGQELPPVINSFGNEVLIWFLSDSEVNLEGWELHYQFLKSENSQPSVSISPASTTKSH